MTQPLIELSGVTKAFAGVHALVDAALALSAGEVTALIGENGAGKSTLVKILTGIYAADSGTIRVDGEPVTIDSTVDAERLVITAVHQ